MNQHRDWCVHRRGWCLSRGILEKRGMDLIKGFEHFVRDSEPLAPYTWLRIGGVAEFFAEPTSVEELVALVSRCHESEVPVRLLGGGSNLLIRDAGVPGIVIRLSHPDFSAISMAGNKVTAGGGARLAHVISTAVGQGLAGLESLVGIPGTVGGAVHGNTGCAGGDIGQWIVSAEVLTHTGERHTRSGADLQFAYRQSSLDELAILSAQFQLESAEPEELTRRMQKAWIIKKSHQPAGEGRIGYIFSDVPGASADQLIEQSGLKGASVGGAEVCSEHANFIIGGDDTSADDVLRLIDLIQGRVREVMGVDLRRQIEVW